MNELARRLQSVRLRERENTDWEDIAVVVEGGVSYIYLADTGNNGHDRQSCESSSITKTWFIKQETFHRSVTKFLVLQYNTYRLSHFQYERDSKICTH